MCVQDKFRFAQRLAADAKRRGYIQRFEDGEHSHAISVLYGIREIDRFAVCQYQLYFRVRHPKAFDHVLNAWGDEELLLERLEALGGRKMIVQLGVEANMGA